MDAGSPWDPSFNGEPRWDKPILTYALIEISFAILGRSPAAARVPSILEGVFLILVVGFVVNRLGGAVAARWSAFILATTTGVQIFARVAHPEIGVVLMITTAELLAVLWLTDRRAGYRRGLALVGGVALGLGVLFKGPVAIVLPLLAVVTSSLIAWGLRWPSRAAVGHALLSGAVGIAIALPGYIAMTWRHGRLFIEEAVWRHNVGRFVGNAFVHRSRPWFFIVPALVAMFPWSGLLPAALVRAKRTSGDPLAGVMAAAAATSFLFYSASGSKLPHYALVFVPPLAILIALWIRDVQHEREHSWSRRLTVCTLSLAATALALSPLLVARVLDAREILTGLVGPEPDLEPLFERALWPAASLLVLAATAAGRVHTARAPRLLVVVGAVLPTITIFCSQPLLARAYPWERFGPALRSRDLPAYLIGPRAPSLTFYAGRVVRRLSEREAEAQPLPSKETWVVRQHCVAAVKDDGSGRRAIRTDRIFRRNDPRPVARKEVRLRSTGTIIRPRRALWLSRGPSRTR